MHRHKKVSRCFFLKDHGRTPFCLIAHAPKTSSGQIYFSALVPGHEESMTGQTLSLRVTGEEKVISLFRQRRACSFVLAGSSVASSCIVQSGLYVQCMHLRGSGCSLLENSCVYSLNQVDSQVAKLFPMLLLHLG